ncbi:uncharacterized protein G2W53_023573 [Senna tora]|uniref:Uncharacterized protein n=1 Tax=Senna tora TaxID=362788 RepID=A0A834WEL8_9FABA|nr:uncharacterized protein G2W53_023573 [Senna tora]
MGIGTSTIERKGWPWLACEARTRVDRQL